MLNYLGFHRYKLFTVFVMLAVLQVGSLWLIHELDRKSLHQERLHYAEQVKKSIKQSIEDKQNATIAIGLMLSHAFNDKDDLLSSVPDETVFKQIRESSDYKNLWFQVVDRNGLSLYRSWSNERGSLAKIRPEFEHIIKTRSPLTSISSGRFDLSIKAVVPIYLHDRVSGFIDLISHFNSIQKRFEKMGIDSLVLATADRTKLITDPFSQNRLGPFYVANLQPNQKIMGQLSASLVSRWFDEPYKVWQDYLVVPYALKANNQHTHGYFISFVPLNNLHKEPLIDMAFKDIKEWVLHADIALSILILVAFGFYLIYSQKQYYKNILNAENEMVLVTDGHRIYDGNTLLFEVFPQLVSENKKCVCDFFIDGTDYLSKFVGNKLWLDYLLEHPQGISKAKIKGGDGESELVLNLKAQKFDENKNLSVVVLTDITQLETLQDLSRTDALTRAGNRRAFDFSLGRAVANTAQNESDLVLMLLDLDHFKQVNDNYGHQTGDQVLKEFSDLVFEQIEHRQHFYRIGGEEFAILLEGVDLKQALRVAEMCRHQVDTQLNTPKISVSVGVAKYEVDDSKESFFERADAALYQAKCEGRNRVIV